MHPSLRTIRRALATAVLAAFIVAGAMAGHSTLTPDSTAVAAVPASAVPPGAAERTIGASEDSYAPVVARVAPAVVTIHSEKRVREAQQFPFFQDPSLRDFFGDRSPQSPEAAPAHRESALGSGVLISQDGYILTNHHVVDGADDIKVELTDRHTFDAKLIGSDAPSDLAVLKITGTGFHTLPLGDSDAVRVGDIVLAIGNPMGVGQTVTMGIVSGKGRATGVGDGSFEDFLQTDAPINRGNSGGALVNTRGELIGINSQILSPSGGNIGIGFAIPATMARGVMDQLIADGKVRRGMLGVTVQPVTSEMAASLRLSEIDGAIVSEVTAGGSAERAGIKRGDVITHLNGATIDDSNSLRNQVARLKPRTKVELTIVRDGRSQTLNATLGQLPVPGQSAAGEDDSTPTGKGLGFTVEPLTPELADQLGVGNAKGLVVSKVDPDGPGAAAGIRSGDVIEEIDGKVVRSAADVRQSLQADSDRPALLLINREGRNLFVPVPRNQ